MLSLFAKRTDSTLLPSQQGIFQCGWDLVTGDWSRWWERKRWKMKKPSEKVSGKGGQANSKKSPPQKKPGQGSVDIYAAQCQECLKWRVIDTQEEFEDIRQKISEEPFYCNRKPNTSCDDPADIEYDATRTWVIDKPNLRKTPEGFKRSLVLRKDYSKMDPYYITPSGKKLRTRNEMASYLKEHPEIKDVSASDFDFGTPKIMQDTIPEIVGKKASARKKVKMSSDDNQVEPSS